MNRILSTISLLFILSSVAQADIVGPPPCTPQISPAIEVSLDGRTSAYIGETVTLTASAYDLDSCTGSGPGLVDQVTFAWYFDDVEYVPGRNLSQINVSFPTAGFKHIEVVADDAPLYADDVSQTADRLLVVEHAPEPPIHATLALAASANGPWRMGTLDVKLDDAVYFTGQLAEDPSSDKDVNASAQTVDDAITSFAWDFGDESTGTGANTSHVSPSRSRTRHMLGSL